MKCVDIEIALVRHYDCRVNLIVPNVSWGFGVHECDLLMVSKSGYATEIEIKISKDDLVKDAKKEHQHRSEKICRIYFAIPTKLVPHIQYIPNHAGIIEVRDCGSLNFLRIAEDQNKYKLTTEEMYRVARLGAIKLWSTRKKLRTANDSKLSIKQ